ncbi:MAG: hypothetical protein A3C30_04695 [Candidatus Levybacteria bacterium RIFCSPHIGHO2_02_FULL_40_18]|nr:MAG: hypothetical protein A2869_02350 [Candidatus Levybacteria bacterium RIFCSPHIGHO2_01_FULL_40_58]OGH26377.1 MAG: hypothetical protein A3C30_04695 [Candidatus Levybacteria bacterium RIFCSPHIGHO2_02_FULL_40_18]OGH31824.1 MAG: hypothetical protein A3E43_00490 [Candidatus Levybacteria bacterium RIFCSPHIGHO2_12_FULL_40_31]OGH40457.1 MAG: hypothetical protein A2894_00995 [Candidatus Levybacteria bacterium RIFCSPLOWO2_01_FULL_40_64]OGH49164.1 MAG: hypothetical protein A3I54_04395 [Candidatus Lev
MKYSIWTIPPDPIYYQIKATIDQLSKRYQGPQFDPHMTLLGEIEADLSELEQKVKKLATGLSKLELSLGPVSFSTTYFQSVFVRINSTAKLMQLNIDAKKLFDMENNVFMPHMSLLYGDHDMLTRGKAASTLMIPSTSFVIDKFLITQTTGAPSEWKYVATVPFGT